MNTISNTLISLDSDPRITLSGSITTKLNKGKFEITIDGTEREISIETIEELQDALFSLQRLSENQLKNVN